MSADKGYVKRLLKIHEEFNKKLEITPRPKINDLKLLAEFDIPGIAEPCLAISKKKEDVYKYTNKGNTLAVVSDGSAILGLGDIGPEAGIPVMQGKCMLFKTFAGIDAIPIMIDSKDPEEIIKAVKLISPALGAINLEDIAAPKCFEIERRLRKELNIPVMHDDQHGTSIVISAALMNSLKLVGKTPKDAKVVFLGAGAAGTAITKMLISEGYENLIVLDRAGALYKGRTDRMNAEKEELASITNPKLLKGGIDEIMKGADVFIGVSGPGLITKEHIRSMNYKPIIFAIANPIPEIMPADAKEAGAFIVATGRSDFPNQINNFLAFPGVFRGALDVHASDINDEMKRAAAVCLAELVTSPTPDKIIPNVFEEGLALKVGKAVAKAAIASKVARATVV